MTPSSPGQSALRRAEFQAFEYHADDRGRRPLTEWRGRRPRGRICVRPGGQPEGPLPTAIEERGLRLTGSRCGDFRRALTLLEADSELASRLGVFVTHRLPASRLQGALRLARSPDCIQVVLNHSELEEAAQAPEASG